MGPRLSDIFRPLVELTQKGTTFAWRPVHTEAIGKLKEQFVNFTTWNIPDSKQAYQVCIHASGYAIGAVLEQEGHLVVFLTQVMTPPQRKYCIYDPEFVALVTALDRWRHLLASSTITASTDHQALTHLQHIRNTKPLRGRTARWLDFFAEFLNLTLTYLQGSSTKSQMLCPLHPSKLVTPFQQATTPCSRPSRYTTRGFRRDYRANAGIRSRPQLPSAPTPPNPTTARPSLDRPNNEPPDSPEDSPESPSLTASEPFNPAAWEIAYTKCKEFACPYAFATQHAGEQVQHECNHRRHFFVSNLLIYTTALMDCGAFVLLRSLNS